MAENGTNIAKAYVQIIPSAQGMKGNLENLFGGEAEDAGKSAGGKFSAAFGKVLQVGAAAVSAAAAGIGAVVKNAVSSYADYEQLVGGVETLFGTQGMSIQEYADSVGKAVSEVRNEYASLQEGQEKVFSNASEAYKNAGMSANEYMETVTSFAAALTSSLGGQTDIAADVANQAINDMADNANKMGSSMESIQNAYQGFAKQNFTMLDNLKLGYGGTKEEMQRLLADAEKISDIHYDIDNLANIYDAIHVIQEEMGITGTTAKEAASTISGSFAMTKAAWANVMTGIADRNADVSGLINNLVESASALASNIMPVVTQALQGVGSLVTELAPIIAAQLPALITSVLPGLLTAGEGLLEGLLQGIVTALPALTPAAVEVLTNLAQFLVENLPMIVDTGLQLIPALIEGIAAAVPDLIGYLPELVLNISTVLMDNLPLIIDAGINLLGAVLQGIVTALPELLAYVPVIISSLFHALIRGVSTLMTSGIRLANSVLQGLKNAFSLSNLLSIGRNVVEGLWHGISGSFTWIKNMLTGWVGNVLQFIKSLFGIHSPSTIMRDQVGVFLAKGIGVGFEDEMQSVERSMRDAMPDLGAMVEAAELDASVMATAVRPAESFGGRSVTYGDIIINVDTGGVEYDEDELAQRLAYRLQEMLAGKEA